MDLYERLRYVLSELEPWEQKLMAANKKARLKIRKEKETYVEEPPKEEVCVKLSCKLYCANLYFFSIAMKMLKVFYGK